MYSCENINIAACRFDLLAQIKLLMQPRCGHRASSNCARIISSHHRLAPCRTRSCAQVLGEAPKFAAILLRKVGCFAREVSNINGQTCCGILSGEVPHWLAVKLGEACKFDCLNTTLPVLDIRQSGPRNLQVSGDLFLLKTKIFASLTQSITQLAARLLIAVLMKCEIAHAFAPFFFVHSFSKRGRRLSSALSTEVYPPARTTLSDSSKPTIGSTVQRMATTTREST